MVQLRSNETTKTGVGLPTPDLGINTGKFFFGISLGKSLSTEQMQVSAPQDTRDRDGWCDVMPSSQITWAYDCKAQLKSYNALR